MTLTKDSMTSKSLKLTKHGKHGTTIYNIWALMLQRCNNEKASGYEYYGGRGIRVCERWRKFENFYEDMGDRPEGKSLDRIDVNGNYEPENCRWATNHEQSRNTTRSRKLTFDGRTMNQKDWAKELGISDDALHYRLKHGWSVEQALSTSKMPRGIRREA